MNNRKTKKSRRYKDKADERANSLVGLALYQGSKQILKIYSFKSDDDKVRSGKEGVDYLLGELTRRIVFNPAFKFSIATFYDNTFKNGGKQPILKMYETTDTGEIKEMIVDRDKRWISNFKKQHGING
tara:strand:+ start:2037 stop:2420 length:384 start_codon:yes stop_codon:yes gene_type:complete